MNQLPENSLRTYDVTLVTSYLIGLGQCGHNYTVIKFTLVTSYLIGLGQCGHNYTVIKF